MGRPSSVRSETEVSRIGSDLGISFTSPRAFAFRLKGETGEVAGAVTIPRFSDAYRIGDKISSIQGRDLSLRTNAGAPTEEGEVFPSVVGLAWEFEGSQRTILYLSDHRDERR